MARVVPNNPLAFPPSMEVSVGGRATQEQLPRSGSFAYMDVGKVREQERKLCLNLRGQRQACLWPEWYLLKALRIIFLLLTTLWGAVKVFCRLAVSLRTPTMAMRLAVIVGLRASAPTYGNLALAVVSGLSKCHSSLPHLLKRHHIGALIPALTWCK